MIRLNEELIIGVSINLPTKSLTITVEKTLFLDLLRTVTIRFSLQAQLAIINRFRTLVRVVFKVSNVL